MDAGYFSFHSKGACPDCGGSGYERIFLTSDFSVDKVCPTCQGRRFCKESLQIRYKDKTIVDVLEAQRVKLAKELGQQHKKNMLYVLDEPTTGLSLYDTALLLKLLKQLVVSGNSVIVIEHNTCVLKNCDYIIELGPEGGEKSGGI